MDIDNIELDSQDVINQMAQQAAQNAAQLAMKDVIIAKLKTYIRELESKIKEEPVITP